MMSEQNHSPARILRQLLKDKLIVTKEEENEPWPCYVSSIPDTEDTPDDAVVINDTPGMYDGRSNRTGEIFIHEGWNIYVRSADYDDGFGKAKEIFNQLGRIKGELVFIEAAVYRVKSITMTSGIISLGESETRSRRSFSLNGVVSITNYLEED